MNKLTTLAACVVLLLAGCAKDSELWPWNNEMTAGLFGRESTTTRQFHQQQAQYRAENQASMARQRQMWNAYMAKLRTLPPDVQLQEINRMERVLAEQQREEQAQNMIDAQRDTAAAIEDLTNELQNLEPIPQIPTHY